MYIPNDIAQMLVSKKPNSLVVLGYLFVKAYGKLDVEVKVSEISLHTGLSIKSTRTLIDFLCKENVIRKNKEWNAIQITLPEYMFK